jgi:hypothetical protein
MERVQVGSREGRSGIYPRALGSPDPVGLARAAAVLTIAR